MLGPRNLNMSAFPVQWRHQPLTCLAGWELAAGPELVSK